MDLPGVYCLTGGTPEERVAAAYLETHSPDLLVAVLDATALERTLALALELRPRCGRMVLCLNLMDEAERMGLEIDAAALGDPAVYRFRGTDLALRKQDAARIAVRREEAL